MAENNCTGAENRYIILSWPQKDMAVWPCPLRRLPTSLQALAIFCGVCAVIAILYLFLATALQDASLSGDAKVHLAQPMQKLHSTLQLVALAASFRCSGPKLFRHSFTFGVWGCRRLYIQSGLRGSYSRQSLWRWIFISEAANGLGDAIWCNCHRCHILGCHGLGTDLTKRKERSAKVRKDVHKRASMARDNIELAQFNAMARRRALL